MSIKNIIKEFLGQNYQDSEIIKAEFGVTADVWLISDIYVLKRFRSSESCRRELEVEVLDRLSSLPIAKILKQLNYNGSEIFIYEQLRGKSPFNPNKKQLYEIGQFMSSMHKILEGLDSRCEALYTLEHLKNLTKRYNITIFDKELNSVGLEFKNDTIIHGDIFPDNALFIDDSLSGVIDFSDLSVGDRVFDLAVVVMSWCGSDINKIDALLKGYEYTDSMDRLWSMVEFATLYYAIKRYIRGANWQEMMRKREEFRFYHKAKYR